MEDLKKLGEYAQEIEKLTEQKVTVETKVWEIAQEVIKSLEPSLPNYVMETVREQVESQPQFILEMPDQSMHNLKAMTAEIAKKSAEIVTKSLQDPTLWLMDDPLYLSTTLDDNPHVWEKLQKVATMVEEVLIYFKFPKITTPFIGKGLTPVYRLKFNVDTGDRKLTELIEKYWEILQERENIRRQIVFLEQQKLRREAVDKWNSM